MTRSALRRAVLEWIAEGVDAPRDDARFAELALELFRFQYAHGSAYRRFCDSLGAHPEHVRDWREIPAVPTGAFKAARLATFPAERQVARFCSSGTTTSERGAHCFDTLELYEASLLATFSAHIAPEGTLLRYLVLAPSAADAPDSSLSHMFDVVVRRLGTSDSRFYVTAEGWDPAEVAADLARAEEPLALVGTAFAFVHLTDLLTATGMRLALPPGSRVMETGGFKGRSRELERDVLHGAIARMLGVSRDRIVNQYGMCELSSQFYEDTLRSGHASQAKVVPPWVRTRVLDPVDLVEVPSGDWGMLVHYDLANVGSVMAVQTSDEGRSLAPDRFEVRGRLPGAEARGCSIAADVLLSAT